MQTVIRSVLRELADWRGKTSEDTRVRDDLHCVGFGDSPACLVVNAEFGLYVLHERTGAPHIQ